MTSPTRLAVVMACYNRRETTLGCLAALFPQAHGNIRVDVHLLDDASSDGTAEAVRAHFPQTTVIDGTGCMFWGGGMYAAMQSALKTEFDFMLWLNDDVRLRPDALAIALAAHAQAHVSYGPGPQMIVGATTQPNLVAGGEPATPPAGSITYSGYLRRSKWHPARHTRISPEPGRLVRCDAMNGNFVLVPAEIVHRIGIIDPVFVQQLGDIDYAYRAIAAGASVWIAPEPIGTCAANLRGIKVPEAASILGRIKALNAPLGLPFLPWLTFMWRHGGLLAVAAFIARVFRLAVPRSRPQSVSAHGQN